MNIDLGIWLQRIWSSFCRWWKRTTQPRRKNSSSNILFTPIKLWSTKKPTNSVGLWAGSHPEEFISPLLGVEQLRNAQFLPIENLMSQVQWKLPKTVRKSASSDVTIGSIKSEIQWD
jgi:hypothetical protein